MFDRVNQRKSNVRKSVAAAQENDKEDAAIGFSKMYSLPPPPLQFFKHKAASEGQELGENPFSASPTETEKNGVQPFWGKSTQASSSQAAASWSKADPSAEIPAVQLKNGNTQAAPSTGKLSPATVKATAPAPNATPAPKLTAQEKRAQKQLSKLTGQTFSWPNFQTNNAWSVGKFDFKYAPSSKQATVDMKVKFAYPDIKGSAFSQAIQKFLSETNFVSRVQNSWSGKYQFNNVREPQSVWGKLNPVQVKVNVIPVTTGQHFLIKLNLHTAGRANVAPGHVTELFKNDHTPTAQFNPGTTTGEEKRAKDALRRPIYFRGNSSALRSGDKRRLNLYAAYMRRINTPQFTLNLKGHSNKTGDAAANQKLSEERVKNVQDHLKSAGLTNHNYVTSAVGDAGAGKSWRWRKVAVEAKVPPGFTNMQDVTPHEFGHMLGLDDEYVYSKAGSRIDHYGLVRKAFGRRFAELVGKQDDTDSASIMQGGNEVRIHHYVTIWDALVQTTLKKATMVRPRLGYRDWKFIE
ncbi:MAG: OmpA family protein [Bacteroidota bacterium]